MTRPQCVAISCVFASLCRLAWTALVAAAASGCGGSEGEVETYEIAGTVTSGGQAVEEGTISFEDPQTGSAGQAELGDGGGDEIEVPAGSYRVAIEPPMVEVTAPATAPHLSYKEMPSIPERYRTSSTSGLETRVEADAEGVNFDMTPGGGGKQSSGRRR